MKRALISCCLLAAVLGGIVSIAPNRPQTVVAGPTAPDMAAALQAITDAQAHPVDQPDAHQELGIASRTAAAQRLQQMRAAAREARNRAQAQARASRGVSAPRPVIQVSGDLLDRLASCESGMDPRKNTGNGFFGAFQFMPRTWWSLAMGGHGEWNETQKQAAIANVLSTSYEGQKEVVRTKIPVSSWHRQFPGCSRRLGV